MTPDSSDARFSGSIPEIYDRHLVPLIFEPYAADLTRRLGEEPVSRVLEIAAGTGVVTRAMAAAFPELSIMATDLNQAMIDHARGRQAATNVEWRQADALALPFEDGTFDAVVCQFGVMFFPDRVKGYAEARRMLRPQGRLLFNVWDRLADNELAESVNDALAAEFPADPPRFLSRAPYGYWDTAVIASDLRKAGFAAAPKIEAVTARSVAAHPSSPAIGFCQGSPLRSEIESRPGSPLDRATEAATAGIAKRFGRGRVEAKMQAVVVAVRN